MENLVKAIMSQIPINATIEISECPISDESFSISITKDIWKGGVKIRKFSINATANTSMSNVEFFGLVTDMILDFNRKVPLK